MTDVDLIIMFILCPILFIIGLYLAISYSIENFNSQQTNIQQTDISQSNFTTNCYLRESMGIAIGKYVGISNDKPCYCKTLFALDPVNKLLILAADPSIVYKFNQKHLYLNEWSLRKNDTANGILFITGATKRPFVDLIIETAQ